MVPIDELKRKRFQFLHRLYEKSGGNEREMVDEFEFGDELGFDRTETEKITQYLEGEDLIKYEARRAIVITHQGIIEVEAALSHPEEPSQYFPPVNIINIHHMEGSQIQQGSISSNQTGNFELTNMKDFNDFITLLKEKCPELNLNEKDKSEIDSEISTLESQINSSRPKRRIIQESLVSIQRILEGAMGGIVAQQLIPFIPSLLDALK